MNPKLTRLVLAAVLFSAWMGYLAYLVYALPQPPKGTDLLVVLSRPQILVSQVDVAGTINLADGTVQVKEVLYPPQAAKPEKGEEIKVTNLNEVKPPLKNQAHLGECLLPLETLDGGKTYQVVHVPPSPGFLGGDPRVYPATAETLAEYRSIHKPEE